MWGSILGCIALFMVCGCVVVGGALLRNTLTGVHRGPYSLRVNNETGESLCSLNIKAASSQTRYGSDRLEGDILGPGDSFTITGLAEGYYDIKAMQCTDPSIWYGRNSVPVLTEGSEWTLTVGK